MWTCVTLILSQNSLSQDISLFCLCTSWPPYSITSWFTVCKITKHVQKRSLCFLPTHNSSRGLVMSYQFCTIDKNFSLMSRVFTKHKIKIQIFHWMNNQVEKLEYPQLILGSVLLVLDKSSSHSSKIVGMSGDFVPMSVKYKMSIFISFLCRRCFLIWPILQIQRWSLYCHVGQRKAENPHIRKAIKAVFSIFSSYKKTNY